MSIKTIFTKEHIEYFKNNKNEITFDLLESLRSHGNEGKKMALEILDIPKDSEGYYLDAFENRISYDGNISLKKPNTKLNLSSIHEDEIKKCSEDVFYFVENYCKIVTQSGVNFSELRDYQKTFLEDMINEESVCSLQSRQSGKCQVGTTSINILNEKGEEIVTNFETLFKECKKEFNEK